MPVTHWACAVNQVGVGGELEMEISKTLAYCKKKHCFYWGDVVEKITSWIFWFWGVDFVARFQKVYYDTPCWEHLFGVISISLLGRFFSEQNQTQNTEISPGIWESPSLGAIL